MDAHKRCQRAFVQFLTAKNASTSEIYRQMQNVYGTESMTQIGIPMV